MAEGQGSVGRHLRVADGRRGQRAADVIVVGAGPAGSAAATYLARGGLDVLLLEKATFPREKVCGDGLSPRAVKQVIDLGIDTRADAGWFHNRGLRVVLGDSSVELPWPTLASYPPYGMVRTRHDLDAMLAYHAAMSGAEVVEGVTVRGVTTEARSGRITGVRATRGPDREPVVYSAPVVLACDGNSARTALSAGIERRRSRPLGVAVRTYYESSRSKDDHLEVHLGLPAQPDSGTSALLPGYGWIFGMGDGTANVGIGALSTSKLTSNPNYRALLEAWTAGTPEEWGLRNHNSVCRVLGAALPMAFNRVPHYRDGLLLVGDAGGFVSPLTGEGIAYALESAQAAAECVLHALRRPDELSRDQALARYPRMMTRSLGGYFRIGSALATLLDNPRVVSLAGRHGLRRPALMCGALKLLANVHDSSDGDLADRVIDTLSRLVPST